jgi:biopolymer transport protein ExbD
VGCHKSQPTITADDAATPLAPSAAPSFVLVEALSDDVVVAVKADGSVAVEQTPVDLVSLEKSAARWVANRPDIRVRIAADAAVPHALVVQLIDAMKRAGVKRFALMVAPK